MTSVSHLVTRARDGDEGAWDDLVGRYLGMVHAICRGHGLGTDDAADVNQVVWLRLVEHLSRLRSPEAVGGWIAATTRNECLRVLRHQTRQVPTEDDRIPEGTVPAALDERLLTEERDAALWRAFATLSARCQALLRMLAAEPPPGYDVVGAALGMPVGSIGPTRGRCLATLRRAAAGARITTSPADS
jgi:RNA polymerase sigma factor (sigma-70 family)